MDHQGRPVHVVLRQLPYLLLKFKLPSDDVLVLTIVIMVNLSYYR